MHKPSTKKIKKEKRAHNEQCPVKTGHVLSLTFNTMKTKVVIITFRDVQ